MFSSRQGFCPNKGYRTALCCSLSPQVWWDWTQVVQGHQPHPNVKPSNCSQLFEAGFIDASWTHDPPWLFQSAKHYTFGNVVTSPACHVEHLSNSSFLAGSCQGDLQAQILQGTPEPLEHLGTALLRGCPAFQDSTDHLGTNPNTSQLPVHFQANRVILWLGWPYTEWVRGHWVGSSFFVAISQTSCALKEL